jgi:prevent-host-death family protein
MKIVSVADIKAHLSAYLNESRQGPVVVTRNGKAVAVLVAVTDDDELERLVLAHSPKFQALLDKSRRQIEETGGIPHEQFWREVEAERRKADAMTSAPAEPDAAPDRGRPLASRGGKARKRPRQVS